MSRGLVTVINTTPYKEQPVPEVGKEYHIFDDGKISFGRHYVAKVTEVLPFDECLDAELLSAWGKDVVECYWLFPEYTDYIIKAVSDFDKDPLCFVRTKDGGWFSIDYPSCWMGARLDVDGSLYKSLNEFVRHLRNE